MRRISGATEMVGAYVPTSGMVFGSLPATVAPADTDLLWRAVRRAAAAIRSAPVELAPHSELLGTSADDEVDVLCAAWKRACTDGRVELRGTSLPERATCDRLRGAFLEEVSILADHVSAHDLVHMLGALEMVRERVERDESQRFRRLFAGPAAMDLVVEVAHDMRSPLSAILLLTDTLRNAQPGTLSPVAQRQVGLVYSAAFGLHAMVNDVMELAHGGERLFDPEPTSFSVGEIMNAVADIVRPLAEEKQLGLQMTGPKVDSRIGQPLALSRVLANLTMNALKFTREGEVRVVARELSRTAVEFSVEDTGVGIPSEVMSTLFEPFRRFRSGTSLASSFSSAGLGLSICRRLVHSLGAELRVETEAGKGTRFSFELSLPPTPQEL